MRRVAALLLALLLAFAAHAEPPADRLAVLRRGVNLTNWFRFPASADPAALRGYLSDEAMRDLRRVGFSFVRLAVQPEFLLGDRARLALLLEAVARLRRQGLAVVITPFPAAWRLESNPQDRQRLMEFWRVVASALRGTPPDEVFPEVLNEPVFPHDPAGWQSLQLQLLAIIRALLKRHTIVLTGNDWSSVDGLLALSPAPDPNLIYSFHLYDPAELTSLAAYRPGLDTAALARLPFPANDQAACQTVARTAMDAATANLILYYCTLQWDAARIGARIAAAAQWGRDHHVAVLLDEFGATQRLNAASRANWLIAVRGGCERERIGWAIWGYDDLMGFAVARPPASRPRLDGATLIALGLMTQQ